MFTNTVIHVGRGIEGNVFALYTFKTMAIRPAYMREKIFTIEQEAGESRDALFARAKQKARELGIDDVERLD